MKQQLQRALVLASALSLSTAIASADLIPVGLISYEDSGFTFENVPLSDFVLTNNTGTNASAFPVTTWPVETSLDFLDVSLSAAHKDGSSGTCAPGTCLTDNVVKATLAGKFDLTTITLNDGTVWDIAPNSFVDSTGLTSPTITDATGACFGGGTGCLQNGDSAVIYAEATRETGAVPEPYSVVLLGTVCAALLCLRRRVKWNDVD
jgi:hypothetical protein